MSTKTSVCIILNGERMNIFPNIGNNAGCSLLPFLFNSVLKVLATVIRQEKETKGIKIGKEEMTGP